MVVRMEEDMRQAPLRPDYITTCVLNLSSARLLSPVAANDTSSRYLYERKKRQGGGGGISEISHRENTKEHDLDREMG